MKKIEDPGLLYIKSLGFRYIRTQNQFDELLQKELGADTAKRLHTFFGNRSEGKFDDHDFYEYKNSNEKISLTVSGLFDNDIYRKACNWISKNINHFGRTILDIGCDNGIMSCFIAQLLPNSRIIGIDRCPSGIEIAKKLAQRLGLTNVEFLVSDILYLAPNYKFDTVFSMRNMHENIDHKDFPEFETLDNQCLFYVQKLESYIKAICSHLDIDGEFVSIERIERNSILLGWMQGLNKAKLELTSAEIEELEANEVGRISHFQAACYKVGRELQYKYIYELWCKAVCREIDLQAGEYKSWEAQLMFHNSKERFIKGIEYLDSNKHSCGKLMLWTCRQRDDKSNNRTWIQADDALLFFRALQDDFYVGIYDVSKEEELIHSIEKSKHYAETEGWVVNDL